MTCTSFLRVFSGRDLIANILQADFSEPFETFSVLCYRLVTVAPPMTPRWRGLSTWQASGELRSGGESRARLACVKKKLRGWDRERTPRESACDGVCILERKRWWKAEEPVSWKVGRPEAASSRSGFLSLSFPFDIFARKPVRGKSADSFVIWFDVGAGSLPLRMWQTTARSQNCRSSPPRGDTLRVTFTLTLIWSKLYAFHDGRGGPFNVYYKELNIAQQTICSSKNIPGRLRWTFWTHTLSEHIIMYLFGLFFFTSAAAAYPLKGLTRCVLRDARLHTTNVRLLALLSPSCQFWPDWPFSTDLSH